MQDRDQIHAYEGVIEKSNLRKYKQLSTFMWQYNVLRVMKPEILILCKYSFFWGIYVFHPTTPVLWFRNTAQHWSHKAIFRGQGEFEKKRHVLKIDKPLDSEAWVWLPGLHITPKRQPIANTFKIKATVMLQKLIQW